MGQPGCLALTVRWLPDWWGPDWLSGFLWRHPCGCRGPLCGVCVVGVAVGHLGRGADACSVALTLARWGRRWLAVLLLWCGVVAVVPESAYCVFVVKHNRGSVHRGEVRALSLSGTATGGADSRKDIQCSQPSAKSAEKSLTCYQ